MYTRFSHLPVVFNGLYSGLITSHPLLNRTGPGGYLCLSNVSLELFSLLDPLPCLRAHGMPLHIHILPTRSNRTDSSWLIDNDRDGDGMQVIADLHGGDLEDASAKAEFQEIKDRVSLDVGAP